MHDLAYADIVFDGYKAPSIMQVPGARDIAVEFFTMSKSYNMAGWRVGFMVGNRELVDGARAHQELSRLRHVHADPGRRRSSRSKARRTAWTRSRASYQKRRDVLCKGLHEAGWKVEVPKATMYVWAQIPEPYRGDGLARVREEAAGRGEGRGVARASASATTATATCASR